MLLVAEPVHPLHMTATEDMKGQAEATAEQTSAASSIEQPQEDIEARKKWALLFVVLFGTISLLDDVRLSLANNGVKPAAMVVLELSTWVSFLLYLWAVYVARVLATSHLLAMRPLLAVLASIVAAVAASVLAYTFVSPVVGMMLMYLVSLCVAGFFAWCLGDYLRTRNSDEISSTSASCQQEKPVTITSTTDESQEALLQKRSSSMPNLTVTHDQHNAGDLEVGLLLLPGA